MSFQNGRPGIRRPRSNVIRMASVLFTMPPREASIGLRTSFVEKEKRVGSSFNLDTIIGNSFVYGKREKKPGKRPEEIHSFSN